MAGDASYRPRINIRPQPSKTPARGVLRNMATTGEDTKAEDKKSSLSSRRSFKMQIDNGSPSLTRSAPGKRPPIPYSLTSTPKPPSKRVKTSSPVPNFVHTTDSFSSNLFKDLSIDTESRLRILLRNETDEDLMERQDKIESNIDPPSPRPCSVTIETLKRNENRPDSTTKVGIFDPRAETFVVTKIQDPVQDDIETMLQRFSDNVKDRILEKPARDRFALKSKAPAFDWKRLAKLTLQPNSKPEDPCSRAIFRLASPKKQCVSKLRKMRAADRQAPFTSFVPYSETQWATSIGPFSPYPEISPPWGHFTQAFPIGPPFDPYPNNFFPPNLPAFPLPPIVPDIVGQCQSPFYGREAIPLQPDWGNSLMNSFTSKYPLTGTAHPVVPPGFGQWPQLPQVPQYPIVPPGLEQWLQLPQIPQAPCPRPSREPWKGSSQAPFHPNGEHAADIQQRLEFLLLQKKEKAIAKKLEDAKKICEMIRA